MAGREQTILSEHFFARFNHYFAPYLAELGIDAAVLSKPDIEIAESTYVDLWQAVANGEGDAIALEIGSQTMLEDLGPMGHAIRCAPTVRQAMQTLSRFIPVYAQAKRINLLEQGEHMVVTYQVTDPSIVNRRHVNEFAISCILSIIHAVTGRKLKPVRVDFEHAQPASTEAYQRLFDCPLAFSEPDNRLYFPLSLCDCEVPRSDISLYNALQPYLEHQLELRGEDELFQLTVRSALCNNLANATPSLKQLSEQLACSPRTLQRKLQKEGVEFTQLVDDVRREAAISYIQKTDYSITELALRLGYSESSAFSRAFRRWTGQTPQQFRKSQMA